MVNALTVDVEEYFCYAYPGDTLSREEWAELESRAVPHTLETLSILEQHGIRATFFVLAWVAERDPLLVREIKARGHEIGSHGYAHQPVCDQSPDEFRDDVKRSIDVLSDITGEMPVGYRAPSFSINSTCRWALDILAELGFRYDSSLYPVRMRHYGAPDELAEPHVLDSGMWEFPAATVRLAGIQMPFGGGGYLRLYPFVVTRWATHRMNAAGRPAMVYLHPWELDPYPPAGPRSRLHRFQHSVGLAKTRSRLLHLCAEFDFAPIGDVIRRLEEEGTSGDLGVAAAK
ncbi:MAG: XrtA system polysaccharide deacetylase [Armatimonadota bacterium]|nr:XrtA system polysaccharide deacetylase [Armatimonadota bacterium]